MKRISEYVNLIRSFKCDIDTYFRVDNEEIAKRNLLLLRIASTSLIVLILLLGKLAPHILPNYTSSYEYDLFLLFAIAFRVFLIWYGRKNYQTPEMVQGLCVVFLIGAVGFLIAISIFSRPNAPATLLLASILMLPSLFIIKPMVVWIIILVGEGLFYFLASYIKTREALAYDLFSILVSIIFGFIVTIITYTTRIYENNSKLRYQVLSRMDLLTSLMNKKTTEYYCDKYLNDFPKEQTCAILIIDIDNFKTINDSLGHKSGDEVLSLMGAKLKKIVKDTDVVGRIGGDEFLVLLKNISDISVVYMKANRIMEEFENLQGMYKSDIFSCSIGITIHKGKEVDFTTLYTQADQALYQAKSKGKRCYHIFTPAI